MAKILVYSEINQGKVKAVTFEILGKLSGHTLEVVAVGDVPDEAKAELAKYGAQTIHKLAIDGLDEYSPEGYGVALKEFISSGNYDYVFAGSTALGKDLFPRVAGMFSSGMATEVVDFNFDGDAFKGIRPQYAGKCLTNVEIVGPKPYFVTVRQNALGLPDSPTAGSGDLKDATASSGALRAKIKEIIKGASEKLDLTEANVIVSGGRALKSGDNFKILEEMADVIGATVGASRAAVDAGYVPVSMQVGQTGKTVAPSLYIACGISGAIQHLAGMRTSKVIVAINTDPDAPIFAKADYGIVGDLFKIVPIMTEELKAILN